MSERMTGVLAPIGGEYGRRVRYDRSENEPPSAAVVAALAEFQGTDVTGLSTRLYDHVDPEALDALFADRHDGTARPSGRVRFDVDGATVVVRPESVHVYPNV